MLSYETAARVKASHARLIVEEAAAIERSWWRGALGLDAGSPDGPASLAGATPLFHPKGIPDEDDLFMAFADAAFILERLEDWARRFTIKWSLRMNDEDWGAVDPSGPTKPLLERMRKWAGRARVLPAGQGRWQVDEARRQALLARHADRR